MPQGKQRTLQNIQSFIRKNRPRGLRSRLLRDLQKLRIVKEADVECAAYHHLRRYIGEDPKWRVFARKHVKRTGHYIDLLIFKNECPVIALELKWGQVNIEKKDRESLYKALTKLKVQKAYWLSLVCSEKKKKRLVKRGKENNVLHRIIVRLGIVGRDRDDYMQRRELFKSQMAIGRGHK
jgi:hypothetical protein